MRKRCKSHTLFFKLSTITTISIVVVTILITTIIVNISEGIFIHTYTDAQKQAMKQIQTDLYNYNEDVVSIIDTINKSWACRMYLSNTNMTPEMEFKVCYEMKKAVNKAVPAKNFHDISILLIGTNGSTYLNHSDLLQSTPSKIWDCNISRTALSNRGRILYQNANSGFTSLTSKEPVIITTKTLAADDTSKPYGIIYITMKESTLASYYSYFTNDTVNIHLMNEDGKILSSNNKDEIGLFDTSLKDTADSMIEVNEPYRSIYKNNTSLTMLSSKLNFYDYYLNILIHDGKVLNKLYNIPQLVFICFFVSLSVILIVFFIVHTTTGPLSSLTKKMSAVRKGDLSKKAEVTGSYEVQELAQTYNKMLDSINQQMDMIRIAETEKRKAEIRTLQMQINPHYIYNTLTSIKWLIWQGDAGKSTHTIDAFIHLLHNSISNSNELITVSEELENLKNYIYINNTRYGDNIRVHFSVAEETTLASIPKLILQPFVENSFFHAFNGTDQGNITIYINKKGDNLVCEVMDDGIGIPDDKLDVLLKESSHNKEHFSGIGVQNVNERIKLIYGEEYGIQIRSLYKKGTTVTITIPFQPLES